MRDSVLLLFVEPIPQIATIDVFEFNSIEADFTKIPVLRSRWNREGELDQEIMLAVVFHKYPYKYSIEFINEEVNLILVLDVTVLSPTRATLNDILTVIYKL